jgi:two-component system response regulator (stage 0 sporulation protein F)
MIKILVVDDEKSIQILYEEELSEEGYEVITIGDGTGLVRLIEEKTPDLVILDIRLGEHNGLDLLQEIRNTFYDLPVILCTAYPAFKHDLRSIAADHYVVKSSNMKELKLKVRMALESRIPWLDSATPMDVPGKETPLTQQVEIPWPGTSR